MSTRSGGSLLLRVLASSLLLTAGLGVALPAAADSLDPVASEVTAPDPRETYQPLPEREGARYGRIRIPAMGVDAAMVAGTTSKALERGPGIWRAGSLPGRPGNATVSGHRTTHGAWFKRIGELRPGDLIYVDVPGKPTSVYEVRGRAVTTSRDQRVTRATDGVRLTLSTCHPEGSSARRLVVQAELISGEWVDAATPREAWQLFAPPAPPLEEPVDPPLG